MKKRVTVSLIFFLIVSFLIFIFKNFAPFSTISGLIQNIFATPLAQIYTLKTKIALSNENLKIKKLKEEVKKLQRKMVDYESLKMDNQALRAQFEEVNILQKNLLPAHVIGFSGNFFSPRELIIDKGGKDGVKKNMAIVSGKYLVGEVEKVSEYFSQVSLLTDESFSTIGRIYESNALGIIKGAEDFILYDRVVVTEKINVADIIVTKGEVNAYGIGIPPDLIIGKITSINRTETKPFQSAKVESLVDYSKLNMVFVVKKN